MKNKPIVLEVFTNIIAIAIAPVIGLLDQSSCTLIFISILIGFMTKNWLLATCVYYGVSYIITYILQSFCNALKDRKS